MRLDDLFHNREAETLSALLFWVGYEFFEHFIEKIRRNALASILYPASDVLSFVVFGTYRDLTGLCVLYCI